MVSQYSCFLFSIKDICLLDIICYVDNPENAKLSSYLTFYHTIWVKAGEVIRQGPYFDHIILQLLSFVRRIRINNT